MPSQLLLVTSNKYLPLELIGRKLSWRSQNVFYTSPISASLHGTKYWFWTYHPPYTEVIYGSYTWCSLHDNGKIFYTWITAFSSFILKLYKMFISSSSKWAYESFLKSVWFIPEKGRKKFNGSCRRPKLRGLLKFFFFFWCHTSGLTLSCTQKCQGSIWGLTLYKINILVQYSFFAPNLANILEIHIISFKIKEHHNQERIGRM